MGNVDVDWECTKIYKTSGDLLYGLKGSKPGIEDEDL